MAYEVSSWFLDQVSKRNQQPVRKFKIGTSDYTDRVTKFPTFARTANQIKSINLNVPLANADGHFNNFYHYTHTMPNTVTLEIGVTISAVESSGAEGFILLEDGGEILLEDDSGSLLLESAVAAAGLQFLDYDAQTGSFTAGNTITGATSGATATIVFVDDDGTTGTLYLSNVVGTFQNNEIIYESALGSELLTNGNFTNWTGDNPDNWTVFFEDGANYVTESVGGGEARFVSNATSFLQIVQEVLAVGSFYSYSIDVVAAVSGSLNFLLGSNYVEGTLGSIQTYSGVGQCTGNPHVVIYRGAGGDITVDNVSVKQITNAALANGTLKSSHDELLKIYTGYLKNVRYTKDSCEIRTMDRLWDFTSRKVGDSDALVDIGSEIPSDIAWTLCTCYGGLSTIESISNPDINYSSFLAWAEQFSTDSLLMSAHYDGIKITDAMSRLAKMTDSAVWIEGDGKLNFVKFVEPSSLDIMFSRDEMTDLLIDVEGLRVVNKHYTSFDYSVGSNYWTKTVFAQNTLSINTFDLHEDVLSDDSIWHVDSVGALSISHRKVNLLNAPPKRFRISTGLYGIQRQISETVRLTDSFYGITSTSGWRLTETQFNTDTGEMRFLMDEANVMNAFYLDVSFLDGDDLLI